MDWIHLLNHLAATIGCIALIGFLKLQKICKKYLHYFKDYEYNLNIYIFIPAQSRWKVKRQPQWRESDRLAFDPQHPVAAPINVKIPGVLLTLDFPPWWSGVS